MVTKREYSSFVRDKDGKVKIGLFFLGILMFLFLSFVTSTVTVESPTNGSANSTWFFFNVSFANGTDIQDPLNATFYYNLSGTWTEIGSSHATLGCAVDASGAYGDCNATLDISSLTDGNYSINASINNGTDIVYATDLTLSVTFDSSPPNVSAITGPLNATNLSTWDVITLNATITDAWSSIDTVLFNITNSTHDQNVTVRASNVSGTYWNATLNMSNYSSGLYYIQIIANDSLGNVNSTEITVLRLDNTAPSVSLTSSLIYQTSVTLSLNVVDSESGVWNSCSADRSGATITGTRGTQTLTELNLACGMDYSYVITCTDLAGNSGTLTSSLMTLSCGGVSSSGGGSSSSYSMTYNPTSSQLNDGYTKELKKTERVRFSVGTESHTMGIKEIGTNYVIVEIASDPIEVKLDVEGSTKVDLDEDGFYDTFISLLGIEDNKANLRIVSINEEVSEGTNSNVEVTGGEVVSQEVEEISSGYSWGIIGGVVVVLLILGAFMYKVKNK